MDNYYRVLFLPYRSFSIHPGLDSREDLVKLCQFLIRTHMRKFVDTTHIMENSTPTQKSILSVEAKDVKMENVEEALL